MIDKKEEYMKMYSFFLEFIGDHKHLKNIDYQFGKTINYIKNDGI